MIIVFDLDDTLYLERDYVRSGIAAVGKRVSEQFGARGFARNAQRLWNQGRRDKLFDVTLKKMGIEPLPELVGDLVAHYRAHTPTISLAPDAAEFLARPHGCALALITDGPPVSQRRKIEALELQRFDFDPIVCTGEWGSDYSKPHRRAFDYVADQRRRRGEPIAYVADNPAKDFIGPRALGWTCIQIDRVGAVHSRIAPSPAHRPDAAIRSLAELDDGLIDRLATFRLRSA